jgi:hypothetical protein
MELAPSVDVDVDVDRQLEDPGADARIDDCSECELHSETAPCSAAGTYSAGLGAGLHKWKNTEETWELDCLGHLGVARRRCHPGEGQGHDVPTLITVSLRNHGLGGQTYLERQQGGYDMP